MNVTEAEEQMRNVELGESLVRKNARDYILVYALKDGGFGYSTSNRTWAMGAVIRAGVSLEERERLDTRRIDSQED